MEYLNILSTPNCHMISGQNQKTIRFESPAFLSSATSSLPLIHTILSENMDVGDILDYHEGLRHFEAMKLVCLVMIQHQNAQMFNTNRMKPFVKRFVRTWCLHLKLRKPYTYLIRTFYLQGR